MGMNAAALLDKEAFQALYPEEYYAEFASKAVRPDGRAPSECRPPTVMLNTVSSADASASCRLGDTFVTAGARLELAIPKEGSPREGLLEVQIVFVGPGSAGRRRGEAEDVGAALSHILQRHLVSPSVIDLSQLCIEDHKQCWLVVLDIHVLNDDGAILDASFFAAAATLSCLKVPRMEEESTNGVYKVQVVNGIASATPLVLQCVPLALSMGLYRQQLVCDLTSFEEERMGSHVTIILDQGHTISGVYVSGKSVVDTSILQDAYNLTRIRREQMRAELSLPGEVNVT